MFRYQQNSTTVSSRGVRFDAVVQDERLIGKREGIKEGARNMIMELKANNADNSFILRVVKNAFKERLSDEETNELIKDIESKQVYERFRDTTFLI